MCAAKRRRRAVTETRKRAVIFDMDGVIVDSSRYHYEAWQKVFGRIGLTYSKEDFLLHFGRRSDAVVRHVMGEDVPFETIAKLCSKKEVLYRKLAKAKVRTLPGVMRLIKSLEKSGFALALSSSSALDNIDFILGPLKLSGYFDAIVHGDEVKDAKPSPKIFLLAAKKIGIAPRNCVVIEDAVPGVQAAKRAGMHSIAVTGTHKREELAEADVVVDSLEKIGVEHIERLLGL